MCELFGVSGKQPILINKYLKEFVSHSDEHPNGWGMAVFYGDAVSLEKEPVKASESRYLKERLKHRFEARNMFAHIRLATRGVMNYENSHPFVKRDSSGRAWTLIHNGTIFQCDILNKYVYSQEGGTDSERILCYIIEQINQAQETLGRELGKEERFHVIDKVVLDITPGNNKVNFLLFDGELFYVHTNYKDSLHQKRIGESMVFSTVPLDEEGWEDVTFTQLEAYEEGAKVMTGSKHDGEYFYKEEDMKYIYLDFANL